MAQNYTIATLGSHSALQILKGAKQEGFRSLALCTPDQVRTYKSFGVADEIITLASVSELLKRQDELLKKNAILIPHGSFVAYMDIEQIEGLKVPYFGNKKILRHEADREAQRKWLKAAGLKLPKLFRTPTEIDRAVIIKFHGAQGGRGYFLANSKKDFEEKIKNHPEWDPVIQEYIIGVPIYIHYFHSPLTNEIEIMSFDKRYESNVDSLGRISARDQSVLGKLVDPSYVIVGNIPVVIRESMLAYCLEMGERVVEESKKIVEGGLFGPFCLECIITPSLDIYVFEISARIVAGTNPYIDGSPYTYLKYDVPMSTGRRIAREIKAAIQKKRLSEVLG